jgi:hypothetical protein
LSLLLSGWSLLGVLGKPHWQKKIEIGGKKYHERLRDIFKNNGTEGELKISQPLVHNFFLKQLLIGSSINSYRYFPCLRLPADNSFLSHSDQFW